MFSREKQTFFIKTFGCQQNVADAERIVSYYEARGFLRSESESEADTVVVNTCMIRDRAEEKVYGYMRNLRKRKSAKEQRIVMTGCIVGASMREPSGKMKKKLEKRIPDVELLPLEEVGFEYAPKRTHKKHAWVVISNGCNNFCSFCIVPFSRGKEVSRPFANIIAEVGDLSEKGYTSVTLLGQNVNSYGADLIAKSKSRNGNVKSGKEGATNLYTLPDGTAIKPVMVKHLGRFRIPTLFPYLLEKVARVKGLTNISFISANPWDFSDDLISVIAKNENIDRLIHLPVQSGSNNILKKMNRWYTREEYMKLIEKIRRNVPNVKFATDIIVGFPGETEEDFLATVDLAERVKFVKVFAACYSPRPGTSATKEMEDNIPREEKRRRFRVLDDLINHKGARALETKWMRQ